MKIFIFLVFFLVISCGNSGDFQENELLFKNVNYDLHMGINAGECFLDGKVNGELVTDQLCYSWAKIKGEEIEITLKLEGKKNYAIRLYLPIDRIDSEDKEYSQNLNKDIFYFFVNGEKLTNYSGNIDYFWSEHTKQFTIISGSIKYNRLEFF